MFDSLLGRKFTAKCKHAIKCIQERLKPIRKRKQAVVSILRKDIADLLRSGNEAHAFGRMDGLIVEMNRLACYDMIQKFCDNVLLQVPLLQKLRECPEEDKEAVSTLIFAAARFSDLPELRDLRHVFTTRYGSAMETSVNSEFKEKLASKAFSVTRKLQLMKDITSEFSVNWDSESLEYKVTKNGHPKKGDSFQDNKSVFACKKDGMLKHVVMEAQDIHAICHEPDPPRKTGIWANEPEKVTPSTMDSSSPPPTKPQDASDVVYESSAKGGQDLDLAAQEERMVTKNERAFHLIPPPYVKPFGSMLGSNTEHAKPFSQTTHEGVLDASDKLNNGGYRNLPKEELVVDDDNPKPRSVRTKQPKPRVAQEIDGNDHGNALVNPIPHGQRKHALGQNASSPQDGYDGEEIVMDKLLIHYSKKGMPGQPPSKHRTKTKTVDDNGAGNYQTKGRHRIPKPQDYAIDNDECREHQANGRYQISKAEPPQSPPAAHVVQDGETLVHQSRGRHQLHRPEPVYLPERTVKVPPGPVIPKEVVMGPSQATLMQPDSLSPSDGRTHPRLPDYEELTARFAALRKG